MCRCVLWDPLAFEYLSFIFNIYNGNPPVIRCVDFDLVRTDHFNVDGMKELFEKVQADFIVAI